jgi:hypothetical protein
MTHSGLESTEHTSIEAGDRFLLYSGMTCIVAVPGTWPGTSARLRAQLSVSNLGRRSCCCNGASDFEALRAAGAASRHHPICV